ncbi:MAG: hypothetical protein IJK78_11805 [Bacteroidales bacterium]|nr:hypothetical protein [Bacteroidales bacterium]
METPKQVIEASKGLGKCVEYDHSANGYDVYVVYTPSKADPPTPTGLPVVILFKDGKAQAVTGVKALDWL